MKDMGAYDIKRVLMKWKKWQIQNPNFILPKKVIVAPLKQVNPIL